jgi:glycerophosphoryl diester phosphodiesterase
MTTPPESFPPARIIAHRGASRVAPENTLAALRAAAEAGARAVEFDVSLLGDGTAVLHHDPTLERCTDASGPLSAIGIEDLARIDAGSRFAPRFAGERVPTLRGALDALERLGLSANLEIKPHGQPVEPIVAAVAEALSARPWTGPGVLVSSFDLGAVAALRGHLPRQPVAALYETPPADWPEEIARLGAEAMHMDHRSLAPEHLEQAEESGIALRVYTVTDPAAFAPFRRAGLAGVITDDPAAFLADAGWAEWAAAA